MSQDNVVNLEIARKTKKKQLTDRDRLVYAYHEFVAGRNEDAIKLLNDVSEDYYKFQLNKDIARALLCWATCKTTLNFMHRKESEFYIIISNLVSIVTENKLLFKRNEYFYLMRQELFKDFM